MTDRSSDPTAHDLPTTAELGERMTRSTLQRYTDERSTEADHLSASAMLAIRDAREELARIEAELAQAYRGEPYHRPGRIDGLDAQAIYDAFSAIETAAQLREIVRRELEAERTPAIEARYGYGDSGHPYDPGSGERCRWAGSGYCDGTAGDPSHERRDPEPDGGPSGESAFYGSGARMG